MRQHYVDPSEYYIPWPHMDTGFREHLFAVTRIHVQTATAYGRVGPRAAEKGPGVA